MLRTRRQAATCRALAAIRRQNECGWRDLAEAFRAVWQCTRGERQAAIATPPDEPSAGHIETLTFAAYARGACVVQQERPP